MGWKFKKCTALSKWHNENNNRWIVVVNDIVALMINTKYRLFFCCQLSINIIYRFYLHFFKCIEVSFENTQSILPLHRRIP